MKNPNYEQLYKIVRKEEDKLIFNFSDVDFLNTFEITELLFYSTSFPDIKEYVIEVRDPAVCSYLERINFFHTLSRIKGLTNKPELNSHTGKEKRLVELATYKQKTDFYGNQSKIYQMLIDWNMSEEKTSLVVASLAEIVDNAFFHNLGKWNLETGSLLINMTHHSQNELIFSLCDFGEGFCKSLLLNYPDLKTESEAIKLAIQPKVTGRLQKRGGNGLDFLQRNTFNGFKGNLFIRSGNTLVKISSYQNAETLNDNLKSTYGANVCFTLTLID